MGFLAPWFLAGAVAAGLPIYLHLLRRHRTTPLPFSSLMFFERRTQSSIKHRRLRYLLLLAFRLAVILLLALAFANPFIQRSAASMSAEKLDLLVIDDSFSMRAGTRLADAKRDALAFLGARKPSDRAQVMALASQLHVLTEPTQDSALLHSAVDSIEPGDTRGSFGELARTLRSMAETVHTPIELHLFSDMQRSAMPRVSRSNVPARKCLRGASPGSESSGGQLDRRKRQRAGRGVRSQESTRAGGDLRLSHAGGEKDRLPGGKRKSHRHANRGRSRQWSRQRGVFFPRRSLRPYALRGAPRFRGFFAG